MLRRLILGCVLSFVFPPLGQVSEYIPMQFFVHKMHEFNF